MGLNLNSSYALAWWVLLAVLVVLTVLILSERDKRKRRESVHQAADEDYSLSSFTKDLLSTLLAIALFALISLIFWDGEGIALVAGLLLVSFALGRGLTWLRERWRQGEDPSRPVPR